MTSLLHIIDEDGLKNNPNLKFDPQNAAAHLNPDHPAFNQLKEGLTPEQLEILESVTEVNGFSVDGSDDDSESTELVDPETGETIILEKSEFTLDELGFIDPDNLKTLVMEAFYNYKLHNANKVVYDRYIELHRKQLQLARSGGIGKLEASNVNALLGGTLYDNFIMESFTKEPTKVNFNLVMEEMDAGKAAMVAGGTIIGATILYKLIKWFVNVWNKNGTANKSIGDNIKAWTERKARVANTNDIILNAQNANNELKALIAKDKKGVNTNELNNALKALESKDPTSDKQFASQLAKLIINSGAQTDFDSVYCAFWQAWLTNQPVNGVSVNKAYGDATKNACDAASAILSLATSRLEKIRNTAANETISDSVDPEFNRNINTINEWAKLNGFQSGVTPDNFQETSNNFTNHVLSQVVKVYPVNGNIDLTTVNLDSFNEETFGSINEDLTSSVAEFGNQLEKTGGTEKGKVSVAGKSFGKGNGTVEGGAVNKGDDVQRDTRVREYNKAAEMFRGAMNTMRALHMVRNSLGRGLQVIEKNTRIVGGK